MKPAGGHHTWTRAGRHLSEGVDLLHQCQDHLSLTEGEGLLGVGLAGEGGYNQAVGTKKRSEVHIVQNSGSRISTYQMNFA